MDLENLNWAMRQGESKGWQWHTELEHIPLGGTAAAEIESVWFSGIYKKTENICTDLKKLLKLKFVFDGIVYCFNKVYTQPGYYVKDKYPRGILDLKWWDLQGGD